MKLTDIAAAAALALFAMGSAASATVQVGSYTNGNCYPALCNDSGTNVGTTIDYQQVYDSTAFSGPLTIDSITFIFASQFGGNSNVLSGDYVFYLSYSANPVDGLSSVLSDNVSGSQFLFFSGHSNGTDSADPSTTINGNPFFYDPSNGDLLLEVIASNQDIAANGSGNGYFEADNTGSLTSRAYCVTNLDCTSDATGLVTEFNATVPEPISVSLFGAGLAGAAAFRRRRRRMA